MHRLLSSLWNVGFIRSGQAWDFTVLLSSQLLLLLLLLLVQRPHFENHWSREIVVTYRQQMTTVVNRSSRWCMPGWRAGVSLRQLCLASLWLQQFKEEVSNDNFFWWIVISKWFILSANIYWIFVLYSNRRLPTTINYSFSRTME